SRGALQAPRPNVRAHIDVYNNAVLFDPRSLRRKTRQVIKGLGTIDTRARISFRIRENPMQHIGRSNDAQLRQLPFCRTRTCALGPAKFNSFNERIVVESGPIDSSKRWYFARTCLSVSTPSANLDISSTKPWSFRSSTMSGTKLIGA